MTTRSYLRNLAAISLTLFTTVLAGEQSGETHTTASLKRAMGTVEEFYRVLLSESPPDKCPDIFTSDFRSGVTTTEMWQFLRSRRELFLTERFEKGPFHKPEEFVRKATKTISFFNPWDVEEVVKMKWNTDKKRNPSGLLYITLVTVLSDGIFKEIAFPLVMSESTGEYRIEFDLIKVNGVLIDAYGNYKRDFDLFDQLGFRKGNKHGLIELWKGSGAKPSDKSN